MFNIFIFSDDFLVVYVRFKCLFHVDLDNAYDIAASTCECLKLCMPSEYILETCTLHAGPFCDMTFIDERPLIRHIHTG